VAVGDVIKNAAGCGGRSARGIASAAAAGTVFRGSELVINRGGIALRRAGLLVNQGLNGGGGWRRERSAACAGPSAGIGTARGASIGSVRPAENVVVAPEAVGSEERNVRRVAHAIGRIAEDGLPGWLGPSGACAADDSVCRRRARGALTRTTAARNCGCEKGAEERVVAQTRGTVGGTVAEIEGEQVSGAGIVPRNFGNVGNCRTEVRGVRVAPEICVGAGERVAEIGGADGNVVWSGSKGVDTDTVHGFGGAVVAPGGAAIACGDEDGDAFRDCLLVRGVVGRVCRGAVDGFALAVADAHD